ncbi:MAG TPA: hypothetical protein VK936_14015 [Longimicrobiales bacterium]|nr:hypothetical protein [Longimicrobiales bacterium]
MNEPLEPELLLAFAPVHKRAFGTAVGTAAGLAIALLTVAGILLDPGGRGPIGLLGEYFAGYAVTWVGAAIGAAWGFFVGFVAGWFVAFARNLVVAGWIFAARTRAELRATRDFLDHI